VPDVSDCAQFVNSVSAIPGEVGPTIQQTLLGAPGTYSFVPIAQALHHGNVHREQICSVLTTLGLEPPDLQVWAYAEATGHAREVR